MPLIVPIYILKYKKMITFFFSHVEGSEVVIKVEAW